MRESATEQHEGFALRDLGRDLRRGLLRPATSRDIWLALDENHEDSRRVCASELLRLEPLSLEELTGYHRQLFYWLITRSEACWFAPSVASKQGPPIDLNVRN